MGVSWDLTGRGVWLVRGGYGIFYDSGTLIENSALYFNPPYFSLQLFFPGAQPLTLANPFPAGRGFSPRPAINTLDPDLRTGYSQQGTLGLEGVVAGTTTARPLRDVARRRPGAEAQHQPGGARSGPDRFAPSAAGLGDILLVESDRDSSTYTRSRSARSAVPQRGVSFRAAYTLGKSMDDTSAFLATDGDDNTPQDSRNLAAEWGPSDYDVRQRLVLTAQWAGPRDAGWRIARNWQASAVFTAQSGRPFTPRVSFDNSNTGNVGGGTFAYDRPNIVAGHAAGRRRPSSATAGRVRDRAAVHVRQRRARQPGRTGIRGAGRHGQPEPGGRRARRADAAPGDLQRPEPENYQLPDSFVDRATFGRSLSAFPPRQLQLAVRFAF